MPESKAFGDVIANNSFLVMPSTNLLTAAGTSLISARCRISGLVRESTTCQPSPSELTLTWHAASSTALQLLRTSSTNIVGCYREAESVRQRRAQSHHATLMLHKTAACCQHGAQNHSSTNDGFILCAWRADMRSCALDSNTMPCKAGPTFGAWSLFHFLTYRGKLIPFTEVQHT